MAFSILIQIKTDDQMSQVVDVLCRRNSEKRPEFIRRLIREEAVRNGVWPLEKTKVKRNK